MAIKTILYLGQDQDLLNEIKVGARNYLKHDFEVINSIYTPGELIKLCEEYVPNITIIETLQDINHLTEELRILKGLERHRSSFTTFICKDEDEASKLSHLLVGGIQMFFIHGGEKNYFLRDCLYLGLEEKFYLPEFALASNLFIRLEAELLSTITATSNATFLLEADIKLEEHDEIRLKLPYLFEGPGSFELQHEYPSSLMYPMLESYEIKYPVVGPWDAPSEDNLQQETLDTWIEALKDQFDVRKHFVCVFSTNLKVLGNLSDVFKLPFFVKFYDEVGNFIKSGDRYKRPKLYFYDISEETNEAHAGKELVSLIDGIKSIAGYTPIIVIFNSKLSSERLKKSFDYDQLMALPDPLCEQNFKLFTNKLIEKQVSPDHGFNFLRPTDNLRVVGILTSVLLSSLSEHEISFYSPVAIPMFSVLRFDLPMKFYVTIIPPMRELFQRTSEHHYMGIIHGIDENNLSDLRKVVNQLIYRPIKEMNQQVIDQMLKQDYAPKPNITIPIQDSTFDKLNEEEKEVENITLSEAYEKQRFKLKRKSSVTRSKL